MTPEQSAEATFNAQRAIEAFLEEGLNYEDIRYRMNLAWQGANKKPNGQEGYERWMRYFNAMMEILDILDPVEPPKKEWTVDDLKKALSTALARSSAIDTQFLDANIESYTYGTGNTELDNLCDEGQALDFHIQNLYDEITMQEAFERNKRLCDIACAHVPGSKWPNEEEFNRVRQTIMQMLCGTYDDNGKYTKEQIILHAQERKEDIFDHGIYTDHDELELMTPYVMYNMAQDLPD